MNDVVDEGTNGGATGRGGAGGRRGGLGPVLTLLGAAPRRLLEAVAPRAAAARYAPPAAGADGTSAGEVGETAAARADRLHQRHLGAPRGVPGAVLDHYLERSRAWTRRAGGPGHGVWVHENGGLAFVRADGREGDDPAYDPTLVALAEVRPWSTLLTDLVHEPKGWGDEGPVAPAQAARLAVLAAPAWAAMQLLRAAPPAALDAWLAARGWERLFDEAALAAGPWAHAWRHPSGRFLLCGRGREVTEAQACEVLAAEGGEPGEAALALAAALPAVPPRPPRPDAPLVSADALRAACEREPAAVSRGLPGDVWRVALARIGWACELVGDDRERWTRRGLGEHFSFEVRSSARFHGEDLWADAPTGDLLDEIRSATGAADRGAVATALATVAGWFDRPESVSLRAWRLCQHRRDALTGACAEHPEAVAAAAPRAAWEALATRWSFARVPGDDAAWRCAVGTGASLALGDDPGPAEVRARLAALGSVARQEPATLAAALAALAGWAGSPETVPVAVRALFEPPEEDGDLARYALAVLAFGTPADAERLVAKVLSELPRERLLALLAALGWRRSSDPAEVDCEAWRHDGGAWFTLGPTLSRAEALAIACAILAADRRGDPARVVFDVVRAERRAPSPFATAPADPVGVDVEPLLGPHERVRGRTLVLLDLATNARRTARCVEAWRWRTAGLHTLWGQDGDARAPHDARAFSRLVVTLDGAAVTLDVRDPAPRYRVLGLRRGD